MEENYVPEAIAWFLYRMRGREREREHAHLPVVGIGHYPIVVKVGEEKSTFMTLRF